VRDAPTIDEVLQRNARQLARCFASADRLGARDPVGIVVSMGRGERARVEPLELVVRALLRAGEVEAAEALRKRVGSGVVRLVVVQLDERVTVEELSR
jgi:hypothetical protein